jgi:hypothetical protein
MSLKDRSTSRPHDTAIVSNGTAGANAPLESQTQLEGEQRIRILQRKVNNILRCDRNSTRVESKRLSPAAARVLLHIIDSNFRTETPQIRTQR